MRTGRPWARLAPLGITGLCLTGVVVAHAQILHNDFTQQSSVFSTSSPAAVLISPSTFGGSISQKYDAAGKPVSSSWFINNSGGSGLGQLKTFTGTTPGLNDHLNDSRATLPSNTFDTRFSPMNGKMSDSPLWQDNFPRGRDISLKMAPNPNERQPEMQSSMQRNSSLNDFTNFNRWKDHKEGPTKFTDAFTFHTASNQTPQFDQVGRELSLQDINRYEFQGSFSSQPGLPVTHAAGDIDDVHTDGGVLVNQPRLFNFSLSPKTQVRSGGIVAPNMVTSNGSHPYMPAGSKSPQMSLAPTPDFSSSTTSKQQGLPTGSLMKSGNYETTTPGGSKLSIQLSEPQTYVQTEDED